MAQNTKQSVTAAFWQLCAQDMFDIAGLTEQTHKYFTASEENRDAEKEILKSMYSPEAVGTLETFGKELHTDGVEPTLTLGSVLFDIYLSQQKEDPSAPLLKMAYNKKIQDLAALFNSDEFEVPEDVMSVVKDVLSDDKKWKECSFTVLLNRADGRHHAVSISSAGMNVYTEVMSSLLRLFV